MRIIGGTAKGHSIKTPKGMDTRPTLDRVRESIFNVLAHRGIYGARVLDLFSGTGAVAIEALSRGEESAIAVDFRTGKLISENAIHCRVDNRIQIVPKKLSQLKHFIENQQFDYIFSDPPYKNGFIQETIDFVVAYDVLADDGVLVLEHHKDEVFSMPPEWECIKEQKFGYTLVSYFVKHSERS